MRDQAEVEAIADRQRGAEAPAHSGDVPVPTTVEAAIAHVKRAYPGFADEELALLADRAIVRLVEAGVPEPDAVLRGAGHVAQRLGLLQREHADEDVAPSEVDEEQQKSSAIIAEMARGRVGANTRE